MGKAASTDSEAAVFHVKHHLPMQKLEKTRSSTSSAPI
jgi:hypothetical protein